MNLRVGALKQLLMPKIDLGEQSGLRPNQHAQEKPPEQQQRATTKRPWKVTPSLWGYHLLPTFFSGSQTPPGHPLNQSWAPLWTPSATVSNIS